MWLIRIHFLIPKFSHIGSILFINKRVSSRNLIVITKIIIYNTKYMYKDYVLNKGLFWASVI